MRFSAATQTFLLELLCSSCRSGCTALTTAAVTTAVTARRFSSPITSTPDSVLGTLRRSGPGRATWASSAAPSSPTPTEVSVLADRFPSAHSLSATATPTWPLCFPNRETRRSVRGRSSGGGHGAEGNEVPPHRHRDLRHPRPQEHHGVVGLGQSS